MYTFKSRLAGIIKGLSSDLQIFTRNQYSSCWLSAVIGWALHGSLSIKIDYHGICMEHTAIALRKLVFRLSLLLSRHFLLKLTSERR